MIEWQNHKVHKNKLIEKNYSYSKMDSNNTKFPLQLNYFV